MHQSMHTFLDAFAYYGLNFADVAMQRLAGAACAGLSVSRFPSRVGAGMSEVSQDTQLFRATILENVTCGLREDELRQVLHCLLIASPRPAAAGRRRGGGRAAAATTATAGPGRRCAAAAEQTGEARHRPPEPRILCGDP